MASSLRPGYESNTTYTIPNTTEVPVEAGDPYKNIFLVMLGVIIILGICGNILGAVVLFKLQRSVPGVRLLKLLAFIDIIILFCLFTENVLRGYDGFPGHVDTVLTELTTLQFPFTLTCYTFEIYFTMLIACQRAVAVAKPLQAAQYLRRSVINISIMTILVLSILLNLPFWLAIKCELYWDTELEMTWISSTISKFASSDFFRFHMKYTIFVFRAVIPMLFLVVCNLIIIVFSRRRLIKSTRGSSDQLAAINIAIILMSVVTHVTSAVEMAVEFDANLNKVTTTLLVLNCSANFVFYCVFGRSFRNMLKDILKCIHWQHGVGTER